MATVNPLCKEWVNYLRNCIPGELRVTRQLDEREQHGIDIFTSTNAEGVVAATIGLMDYDQSVKPKVEIFTEILMDSRGQNPEIANVLATIAFYVMKDRWKAAPGIVFETVIETYLPKLRVKHILFVPPYQWDGETMTKVKLSSKTVYPLLAVPITDAENEFIKREGADRLQDIWAEKNTDVLDWRRRSAV